jgi:hypothetical protein
MSKVNTMSDDTKKIEKTDLSLKPRPLDANTGGAPKTSVTLSTLPEPNCLGETARRQIEQQARAR